MKENKIINNDYVFDILKNKPQCSVYKCEKGINMAFARFALLIAMFHAKLHWFST